MATILVVDDRPVNREMLVKLLGYRGHGVLEAEDATEALEQIQRSRPDLVITDVMMRTIDGFELLRRIRSDPLSSGIPVILYSAVYHGPEAGRLAALGGAISFLAKPAEPEVILAEVNRVLGSPASSAPAAAPEEFREEHRRVLTDKLSGKVSEVETTNQTLAALVERLTLLRSIDRSILRSDSPEAIAENVLRYLQQLAPFRRSSISRFDFRAGRVKDLAALVDGAPGRALDAPLGDFGRLREELETLAQGRTLEVDLAGYGEIPLLQRTLEEGARYCAFIPLIAESELLGSLNLGCDRPDAISLGILETGREVADQLAVAIQQARQRRALRESEDRFLELAENIDEVFWISGPDLRTYMYVSPACERIWGVHAERLYDGSFSTLDIALPEDRPRVVATVPKLLAGVPAQVEFRIRRPDGEVRWLSARAFPIRDATGRVVRIVGLTSDATDRKRAEQQLAAARDAALEASRLKSAFLANMSHEIRTPLNVIVGSVELLDEGLGAEDRKTIVDGIRGSSRRLLDTVHGVLDLAKLETQSFEYKPTSLGVGRLIEQNVREFAPLARAKGVALEAEIQTPEDTLLFDEYCLSRALYALIDNAVKFTAQGKISVQLRRDAAGPLVLEVRDTGIGIDENYRQQLFEPFSQEDFAYTRRFEGNGLGLSLAKRFVELGGARITVESVKGRGTTVAIRFAA